MPDFRQILCAVEPAAESVTLVRSAAQIAHELGAELRLVHAIPVIDAAADINLYALSGPDAMFAYARDEIRRIQAEAGTNFEAIVEPGDVSLVVHRAATKHKAGLVITGRGCLQETLGRLRTHEYAIIRDAPCPVLSLYTGPAVERVRDEEFAGS